MRSNSISKYTKKKRNWNMETDFIHAINKDAERRLYTKESKVELRARENEQPEIFGYGSVFNSDSHVLRTSRGQQFIERILPGAFDHLLDDPEIVSLFNHSQDYPLARNKRSMTIGVDDYGFWYRYQAPNSPMGQNISESIRRGDVVGSSFSFFVSDKNEEWEMRKGMPALRNIKKIDKVIDLGPVTFEAYPATRVITRNFKIFDDTYLSDLAAMDLDKMRRGLRRAG
jgi:HK97 family phage prohead protease